jgi:hypothetical protein
MNKFSLYKVTKDIYFDNTVIFLIYKAENL